MLTYNEEKIFTMEQVQELFLSVNWVSGQYPQRLYKALMHSSTVLTVRDDSRLGSNWLWGGVHGITSLSSDPPA